MSELFKQTVARLPEILVKNASPMMLRMVGVMQKSMTEDGQLADASYCVLLLKMTVDELASGSERSIRESMDSLHSGDAGQAASATGFSLAIEPIGDDVSAEKAAFRTASLAFDKLYAKGRSLGVRGLRNYERDVLFTCFKQALAKSRMSSDEAAKMLPYVRRALNDELVRLYTKLEAL